MQKLSRSVIAIAREIDRVQGNLATLVVGYHHCDGDPSNLELTEWSEIVQVSVADRHGNRVLDMRRDWMLLRRLDLVEAPMATVLPRNHGISSALEASRLGKAVRRKAQPYLDPHGSSHLVRLASTLDPSGEDGAGEEPE